MANYTTSQQSLIRVFDRTKLFEPCEREEKRFWDDMKEADDVKPLGQGLYFRIIGALGHGVGNPAEAGSWSTPRTPIEVQALVQGARMDSVVEVSQDFIDASEGEGSFSGDGEAEVIMNCTRSLFQYADIMFGSCAADGKLATVNGAVSTSQTVQLAWPDGAYKLRPNQPVDFYNAGTSTTSATNVLILSIDYANAILTMATTVNLTDLDEVYQQGVFGNTFPNGIKNLVSDGDFGTTVYGLARATYPFLNAYVDDGSSPALDDFSEDAIRAVLNQVRNNQGKTPTQLRSNSGMAAAYTAELLKDRTFMVTGRGTPGGMGGINQEELAFTFDAQKLPWKIDRNLPARNVYALYWPGFRQHTLRPADWFRYGDGAIFQIAPNNTTYLYAFIGSQYMNKNLTHRYLNANGLRTHFKDPYVPGDL